MNYDAKRLLIDANDNELSVRKQCALLGLHRSNYYYEPVPIPEEQLVLMNAIDEIYTKHPFYGARRMIVALHRKGLFVGRKKIGTIMKEMGLEAIYPKRNMSKHNPEHKVYPYLLEDYVITRPGEVWSSDITYIRISKGFVYVVAIIDWHSRYVLSWRMSTSLDIDFCIDALIDALGQAHPTIFNTDQGSQFTSTIFTDELNKRGIRISMDGRGRTLDNVFVERLWRSVHMRMCILKTMNQYVMPVKD